MGVSIHVLAYHALGPRAGVGRGSFSAHLRGFATSGLPSLAPAQLGSAPRGFLLTFDDGFADLWTHGLPLLREHGWRAVVFAIASRAGRGPTPARGGAGFSGVQEPGPRGGGPHGRGPSGLPALVGARRPGGVGSRDGAVPLLFGALFRIVWVDPLGSHPGVWVR